MNNINEFVENMKLHFNNLWEIVSLQVISLKPLKHKCLFTCFRQIIQLRICLRVLKCRGPKADTSSCTRVVNQALIATIK